MVRSQPRQIVFEIGSLHEIRAGGVVEGEDPEYKP
jgi:hypothetical protein